jgi:hypothetical protein
MTNSSAEIAHCLSNLLNKFCEDSKNVLNLLCGCGKKLEIGTASQSPHPWNSKVAAPEQMFKMQKKHLTGIVPLLEPAIHAGILTFSLALRADGGYSPTRLNTPSGSRDNFQLQK